MGFLFLFHATALTRQRSHRHGGRHGFRGILGVSFDILELLGTWVQAWIAAFNGFSEGILGYTLLTFSFGVQGNWETSARRWTWVQALTGMPPFVKAWWHLVWRFCFRKSTLLSSQHQRYTHLLIDVYLLSTK
jgi:hypothetical protein